MRCACLEENDDSLGKSAWEEGTGEIYVRQ